MRENRKFQLGLLGIKEETIKVNDIDIRNYAKYVLGDGNISAKRELLTCLKNKITITRKEVQIM